MPQPTKQIGMILFSELAEQTYLVRTFSFLLKGSFLNWSSVRSLDLGVCGGLIAEKGTVDAGV